jgi:hypothetical protein
MPELILLGALWGGFLWYIAVTPKQRLQVTWLVLVALVLASPVLAIFWPQLR